MEACQDDPDLEERPLGVFVFHLLPSLLDDCCLEVVVVEDILTGRIPWQDDGFMKPSDPDDPMLQFGNQVLQSLPLHLA